MAGETDRSLHVVDEPIIDKNKSASGAESNIPVASSSSNAAAVKMADETTPEMSDYWKSRQSLRQIISPIILLAD
jgi:hypothetical protein